MVSRVLSGETLAEVAASYGLTRQRVAQIVNAQVPGANLRQRRRELDGKVAAVREQHRQEEHARARTRVRDRAHARAYTDEQIIQAIQDYAADNGVPTVASWQAAGMRPSTAMMLRRFQSWNAVLAASGLTPRKSSHQPRKYSDEDLLAPLRSFLTRPDAPMRDRGGPRAYDVYVRATGGPASSTIRVRFGSWGEAKRRALAT